MIFRWNIRFVVPRIQNGDLKTMSVVLLLSLCVDRIYIRTSAKFTDCDRIFTKLVIYSLCPNYFQQFHSYSPCFGKKTRAFLTFTCLLLKDWVYGLLSVANLEIGVQGAQYHIKMSTLT